MATLLLAAAGSAIGGSLGGSIGGIATSALGKAAGATLGSVIDQRLTGLGAEAVDAGKVDRFRVMGASEGTGLPRVFGRTRVAGQLIWSSRFLDQVTTTRVGGKGGGSQKIREHSYSVSLAVALCEGEIARVGRVWADGQQLDLAGIAWRVHRGTEDQLPDPLIEAIEGADQAPAYRGVAYAVFENLALAEFGNRIPQFNFEVFKSAAAAPGLPRPAALDVRAVALVPGTGEYALATTPVHVRRGKGDSYVANINNDRGVPDLVVSLEQLEAELPAAKAVSLVVSWFGDDLRCSQCLLQPAVEQTSADGKQMPWRVSGVSRKDAKLVSRLADRPVFGGTPSDASVIEAIRHLKASGQRVMFYPFILMDILRGNGRMNPWSPSTEQPQVPWRGRITLSSAPGQQGSPDKSPAALEEVKAFLGSARPSDFRGTTTGVDYIGPEEWSYRRFILHYAHLCAIAGGVDAFCIGSEMRSLTQVRDGAASYPVVDALCALATDARSILGPDVRIGYAADWSEYFGHHPQDGSGDVLFHLDQLWAHPAIDFIGVDNYMPLSDWRDSAGHADEDAGSIYNLEYLGKNVAGGEGYNWYYASEDDRERQIRTPITDGQHSEPWIYRYKDIASWWSNSHHNRIGGIRASQPTAWIPRSKPIWFTELGCPAVDKGPNQPNVFHDPKSIESFFPYYSTGNRDDLIQQRYLQASFSHWAEHENNPFSDAYYGRMVDLDHCFVWAWDARPWPDYPDRLETWADGENYARGHWLNARLSLPTLAEVTNEICHRADVRDVDVSCVYGSVTGYLVSEVESARQSLQPLMLAHAFDSFSGEGKITFASRHGRVGLALSPDQFVVADGEPSLNLTRSARSESAGRVIISYIRGDADYQIGAAEAVAGDTAACDASRSSVSLTITDGEATAVADRWLSEARVALETAAFRLPPSKLALSAGDLVSIPNNGNADIFRIDRVEELGERTISAVKIEPGLYRRPLLPASVGRSRAFVAPSQAYAEFLDLPLITGDEVPHAPHVAISKTPWTGAHDVYSSSSNSGYAFNCEVLRPATVGETLTSLFAAAPGAWARRPLGVRLHSGALRSAGRDDVLNGANIAAVRAAQGGDWEVIQFTEAKLVAPREYELSGLLRGQAGTDGVMRSELAAGADFILLDSAVTQIEHPVSALGLTRHYRVGPARRSYDDESYTHFELSFSGVGLRPYAPAHVRARMTPKGNCLLSWVRRSRLAGDAWNETETPIGEEQELYLIRIRSAEGIIISEFETKSTINTHYIEGLNSKKHLGMIKVEVAQVSSTYGSGPFGSCFLEQVI